MKFAYSLYIYHNLCSHFPIVSINQFDLKFANLVTLRFIIDCCPITNYSQSINQFICYFLIVQELIIYVYISIHTKCVKYVATYKSNTLKK